MTSRADYTEYEWALLRSTVEFVGFGMLATSTSGPIGKLREFAALSHCLTLRAVPGQFSHNELALALARDADERGFGPLAYLAHGDMVGLIVIIATARLHVRMGCEQVAELLAAKTPWGEADGLKRWLLWIAREVAEASGDRWLGLGRRLSAEEDELLTQLAESLDVSRDVAAPTADELEAMLGLTERDAEHTLSQWQESQRQEPGARDL